MVHIHTCKQNIHTHTKKKIQKMYLEEKRKGVLELVRHIKALAAKTDSPSSILRTHRVEGEN